MNEVVLFGSDWALQRAKQMENLFWKNVFFSARDCILLNIHQTCNIHEKCMHTCGITQK